MARETIPPAIKTFILEHIESVEQLETLLLLASDTTRSWTADAVARELRTSPRSVDKWLQVLTGKQLLQASTHDAKTPEYRYKPESPAMAETLRDLPETYARHRVSIIDLMFNRPKAMLETFANAFKIREDR